MKTRNGFVSNSSTSSFLIYGAEIEDVDGDLEEGTFLEGFLGNDIRYVGLSWNQVKDDETGAQFKARIEAEIKRLFGDNIKITTHEESFYNEFQENPTIFSVGDELK